MSSGTGFASPRTRLQTEPSEKQASSALGPRGTRTAHRLSAQASSAGLGAPSHAYHAVTAPAETRPGLQPASLARLTADLRPGSGPSRSPPCTGSAGSPPPYPATLRDTPGSCPRPASPAGPHVVPPRGTEPPSPLSAAPGHPRPQAARPGLLFLRRAPASPSTLPPSCLFSAAELPERLTGPVAAAGAPQDGGPAADRPRQAAA